MPPNQENQDNMAGWSEPEVGTPVPSFMDHHGLQRGGVLDQMMPLGTMPTAKVKARAKADPLRKTVQTQNMNSFNMEDAHSTPDMMSTPGDGVGTPMMAGDTANMFEEHFSPQAMQAMQQLAPEFQQHFQMPMQTMEHFHHMQQMGQMAQMQPLHINPVHPIQPLPQVSHMPQVHQPIQAMPQPAHHTHPAPARASMQAMQSTFPVVSPTPIPQPQQTRLTSTPAPRLATSNGNMVTPTSASSLEQSVKKAVRLAQQAGSPELESHLQHIQAAAAQDPEFVTLLNFAVTNNSLDERGSAINRKLKQIKRKIKSERTSPATQLSSAMDIDVDHETIRFDSPSHSALHQSAGDGLLETLDEIIASARSLEEPPAKKLKTTASSPDQIDPSLNVTGKGPSHSRRGSSSSLSSVDEELAAAPLPTTAQVDLKSEAAAQDAELDSRRKKMKKNFDDVAITESEMRQQLPNKPLSTSRRKSKVTKSQAASDQTTEEGANLAPVVVGNDAAGPATPPPPTALGRPPKRLKSAAKVKISPVKSRLPAMVAGISRSERRQGSVDIDSQSQVSDNSDYCSACGGTGFLLCCDGCDRAFHFTCLDPPQDPDSVLDEPWFCYICHSSADDSGKTSDGLFSELQRRVVSKNPSSFKLPPYIRDYFEGVRTGENGEYAEIQTQKASTTKSRLGLHLDEPPDFRKLKDAKNNTILCYKCGKSSLEHRDIVPCDYCDANWHTDCINPPLANPPHRSHMNPKTRPAWMCPLHADHDLKNLDLVEGDGVRVDGSARMHKVRRPKNAKILDTALRRGFRNHGLIEVVDESEDEVFDEEEGPHGAIYRVPARGIKLDFIDKARAARQTRVALDSERAAKVRLHTARQEYANQVALSSDISKRRLDERKTVLNLAQLSANSVDIQLGVSELEKLLYALEAEAPEEVVQLIREEDRNVTRIEWTANNSRQEVAHQLTAREREVLLRMQRHISNVLDWRPSGFVEESNGLTNGHAFKSAAATAAAGLALTNGLI